MDAHQRKVDLQAPADLTYLLNNINDAAQKKLDLHIPPVAAPQGEDDAFRTGVEKLVHEYITQTLLLALPSISINGLDASPTLLQPSSSSSLSNPSSSTTTTTTTPASSTGTYDPSDPSYEPYDPRLAARLRSLHASLEAETTRVAELRREAPAKAAVGYVDRLRSEMAERGSEIEALRRGGKGGEGEGGGEGGGEAKGESSLLLGEGVRLQRADRVAQTWQQAVRGLEDLRGVTEAVALLERAKRAVGEVERL